MVIGNGIDLLSDAMVRTTIEDSFRGGLNENLGDQYQSELELMLRQQRNRSGVDQERDQNICRSGSAPPTVDGSLNAFGSLFGDVAFTHINNRTNQPSGVLSDDELRSHPRYLSYYYSHDHINPRLPPPLVSKEDWRVAQRFQSGGSSFGRIGDRRNSSFVGVGDNSSLFSTQPGRSVQNAENDLMELRKAASAARNLKASPQWLERGDDSFIGLSNSGLGSRRKSFADIVQERIDRPAPVSSHHLSRPTSCNAYGDNLDTMCISDPHSSELRNRLEPIEGLRAGAAAPGLVRVQSLSSTGSHGFASAAGSTPSRSTTPEPQLLGRPPSTGLPPVGPSAGISSSSKNLAADVAATLSGLSLSSNRLLDEEARVKSRHQLELNNRSDFLFDMVNGHKEQLIDNFKNENLAGHTNYLDLAHKNGSYTNLDVANLNLLKRTSSSANLYSKVNSSGFANSDGSNVYYQNGNSSSVGFPDQMPCRNSVNRLEPVINDHLDTGSSMNGCRDGKSLDRSGNHAASDLHSLGLDPRYVHSLQRTSDYATHSAVSALDASLGSNYFGASRGDLREFEKPYLALLAQQKQQYDLPLLAKSLYYGNQEFGFGMSYSGNPMVNTVIPSVGSGSRMFQSEGISHITNAMRGPLGGVVGPWNWGIGPNVDGRFGSSLLEEFKSNKSRSFELSDIMDHVVEFSTDQYGSRFIQQKLETAMVEEKTMIFPEIIPHARSLMTDVFGNYVIQKFFEHGTEIQRRELGSQLTGHVLPLSLQMYGCRVIQKALEVVDVDQQTQMMKELDGSVIKCVRDQNGNHVIQKCIECVPQNRIQFIISSFYGQVVSLSTHPYGCRVIQRVLEHCDDSNTQQIIMDEIMQSVCILAQDQYGNYVIQHVLQHGKPHERSAIIRKLAGQIIKMSQQKFASNVVEKCLTFGGPEERQLLVNEMLGSTDENEPLQAMMKDPFGNYVVQKVLETCNDQSRELILSRIKVHLNALKKYTYGKHIVSRVEKLVTAGERRIGLSSQYGT